jgi:hypothetical protein
MRLSILIVSWNTKALLAGCLESVWAELERTLPPEEADVCVIDNASADGSAAMVAERFPWVRSFANHENVGFARANNQALAQTAGDAVLLLNPDTVLHPGALAALLDFLASRPRAGALGARLVNADGSLQPSCHPMLTPAREFWRLIFLDRLFPRATYPMHRWDAVTPRRVEAIKGACLLLRRQALDEVGRLDESYFMYTEEVDLCYRLSQAGWELWYEPAAVVTHFGGASANQVTEEMVIHLYRSKIHFYRKFGGEAQAQRFKTLVRLAYWPRLLGARLAAASGQSSFSTPVYRRLLSELPAF